MYLKKKKKVLFCYKIKQTKNPMAFEQKHLAAQAGRANCRLAQRRLGARGHGAGRGLGEWRRSGAGGSRPGVEPGRVAEGGLMLFVFFFWGGEEVFFLGGEGYSFLWCFCGGWWCDCCCCCFFVVFFFGGGGCLFGILWGFLVDIEMFFFFLGGGGGVVDIVFF